MISVMITPKKVMKRTLLTQLCALCAIGAGLASVQAQLINVQILDDSWNVAYNGGAADPLPVMTGPAVVGSPGDYWNGVTSNLLAYSAFPAGVHTANPIPLNYADGTPSGVSMTLSSPSGTYNCNATIWGNHSPFTTAGSPYSALMQTLVFVSGGQSANVTLTGLTVGQGYNLRPLQNSFEQGG